jgi:ParB-like chromosome segregation protein Spo0J
MKIQSNEIEIVSIDSLIPHPKNCHNHPEEQIERLAKLIDYQGFRNPVIVQKGTNLIVAGHGRLLAAKKLGMKEVPVSYQEFENEAQLYAYIVSDNAIGKDTWATLDLSAINTEMLDLGPDFDIDMLGIKDFTIEPIEKFEMEDELRDDMNKKFILEITFPNDMEMMDIHDDLVSRGYIVKVKDK